MTARERPMVVIGEESAVVREVLRWHLEEHGFDTADTDDGATAVVLCAELEPDVVLLGSELRTLDGFRALKALKEHDALRDVPVVFITAQTATEHLVEGLRLGAHDYLRKPFEPLEVIARVRAAARLKQVQDQLRDRNEELDRIARSDALTGLANRRHLDEELHSQVSLAARHSYPFTVALLDIDRFKAINDTYGHATGDEVLREVARRLQVTARTGDVVGRWGGEEFVVLLSHCDAEGAFDAGERLRRAVSAAPVKTVEHGPLTVTVSVGCATGADEHIVERADGALYAAKEGGRNRTEVAALADAVAGSSSE